MTHVKNNSLRLLLTDQNSNHPSKYATCLLANPCPVKSLSDWPFELVQHGFINYEVSGNLILINLETYLYYVLEQCVI